MSNSNDTALNGNDYSRSSSTNTVNVREKRSGFFFSGIVAGILAAVGMALFAFLLGKTGMSAAAIMFVKYLVLVPVLVWVLARHSNALGDNYKFVSGIRQGGLVTIAAAFTMALMNVFLYNSETSLETGNPTEPSNYLGSAFINGGVVLMECLVLGMVITFICLQFIKRGRPGEESL